MAIDPVCKMQVDEKSAEKNGLKKVVDGKPYYFCSAQCMEVKG